MTLLQLVRISGMILLALFATGCAGTADRMVPDRTPTWMKEYITGSRISRPTDSRGEGNSANYVVTTSVTDLTNVPGVKVSSIRRRN